MNLPLIKNTDGTHTFSRPVTDVIEIELSSRCDLFCRYCPHRTMTRPKVDISREHLDAALSWVRHFVRAGTQRELHLNGIGESTLHPQFAEFVHLAREALGWDRKLHLATNGITFSKHPELAGAIAASKVEVSVSLHRPEKATFALVALRKAGILGAVHCDAAVTGTDWAGQVPEWTPVVQTQTYPCHYLALGRVAVLADGRISTCCMDATPGVTVIGTVADDPATATTHPTTLCRKCHHKIEPFVPGFDQSLAAAPEGV